MWRVQNAVVLRCGIAIDALKQRALPLERFFVCVEIRVFRGSEWLEGRGDCFRLTTAVHTSAKQWQLCSAAGVQGGGFLNKVTAPDYRPGMIYS